MDERRERCRYAGEESRWGNKAKWSSSRAHRTARHSAPTSPSPGSSPPHPPLTVNDAHKLDNTERATPPASEGQDPHAIANVQAELVDTQLPLTPTSFQLEEVAQTAVKIGIASCHGGWGAPGVRTVISVACWGGGGKDAKVISNETT